MHEEVQKIDTQERTVGQWEEFLTVGTGIESLAQIMIALKNQGWIRFIVDENSNIVLGTNYHKNIMDSAGVERKRCLLPDGIFELSLGILKFGYTQENTKRTSPLQTAVENKIRAFLRDQDIKIEQAAPLK